MVKKVAFATGLCMWIATLFHFCKHMNSPTGLAIVYAGSRVRKTMLNILPDFIVGGDSSLSEYHFVYSRSHEWVLLKPTSARLDHSLTKGFQAFWGSTTATGQCFKRLKRFGIASSTNNVVSIVGTGESVDAKVTPLRLSHVLKNPHSTLAIKYVDTMGILFDVAKHVYSLHSNGETCGHIHPGSVLLLPRMENKWDPGCFHVGKAGCRRKQPLFSAELEGCNFSCSGQFRRAPLGECARRLEYMAPESLLGRRISYDGKKADVYSFGAVMCELLTGHPVRNLQRFSVNSAISVYSKELMDLVKSCTDKKSADRPEFGRIICGLNQLMEKMETHGLHHGLKRRLSGLITIRDFPKRGTDTNPWVGSYSDSLKIFLGFAKELANLSEEDALVLCSVDLAPENIWIEYVQESNEYKATLVQRISGDVWDSVLPSKAQKVPPPQDQPVDSMTVQQVALTTTEPKCGTTKESIKDNVGCFAALMWRSYCSDGKDPLQSILATGLPAELGRFINECLVGTSIHTYNDVVKKITGMLDAQGKLTSGAHELRI